MPADQLKKIDYTAGKNPAQPSFYQAEFTLTDLASTLVDCRNYGKGMAIVSGINLGRYWQRGPTHSLHCPKKFLKKDTNEIVIFETGGIEINELVFRGRPTVKKPLISDFSEIGSNIHNHIDN